MRRSRTRDVLQLLLLFAAFEVILISSFEGEGCRSTACWEEVHGYFQVQYGKLPLVLSYECSYPACSTRNLQVRVPQPPAPTLRNTNMEPEKRLSID